jgi:hypothetical protein
VYIYIYTHRSSDGTNFGEELEGKLIVEVEEEA